MLKGIRFRKALIITLIVMIIASLSVPAAFAASSTPEIKIIVNGETLKPEVAPQIIDGRTMVPLRFIAEALGNTVD